MFADGRRFPDDGSRAVVDEEVGPNRCAGMEIDPGSAVRPLGHHAGNEGDVAQVKLVGQALGSDGLDERVGDDDLLFAQGGRVTLEGSLDIGGQDFSEARQVAEKFHGDESRGRQEILVGQLGRGRIFQTASDFATESHRYFVEKLGGGRLDRRRRYRRFIEEARKKQAQKVGRDSSNRLSRR